MLSYLPYHSISLPDFFKWWDVLVWVEASIYAIDEDNEAIAQAAVGREPDGVPPALSLGAGIQAGRQTQLSRAKVLEGAMVCGPMHWQGFGTRDWYASPEPGQEGARHGTPPTSTPPGRRHARTQGSGPWKVFSGSDTCSCPASKRN